MSSEENDIKYAQWLNNSLSEEEKKQFENSSEEKILKAIIEEVDTWELPPVKVDFEKYKTKQLDNRRKVIPLYKPLFAAASIALIFLLGFFSYQSYFGIEKIYTAAGESKDIILPDGSKVIMNGKSFISYNKNDFTEKREITLEGEVYFEVYKKGKFKVNFENGQVEVLGTQFSVLNVEKYTNVKCFEGKVKVALDQKSYILTRGNSVNSTGATTQFEEGFLGWNSKFTRFKNASLLEVISSLEMKYDCEIDYAKVDVNKNFTGQFINTDLSKALSMVFKPLSIEYTIKDQKIILH